MSDVFHMPKGGEEKAEGRTYLRKVLEGTTQGIHAEYTN